MAMTIKIFRVMTNAWAVSTASVSYDVSHNLSGTQFPVLLSLVSYD